MTRLHRVAIVLVATAVLQVAPAGAQWVCDTPGNLTYNCGFYFGLSAWTLGSGDVFTYSLDGHQAQGSIEIASSGGMGFGTSISQCIDGFAGGGNLDGGFWVQAVSGPVGSCSFSLNWYGTAGCTNYLTYTSVSRDSFTPVWDWVGGTFTVAPTAVSVAVSARCYSVVDDFVVRFDDIYLGPGMDPPIFADGFESSDTSKWSFTNP